MSRVTNVDEKEHWHQAIGMIEPDHDAPPPRRRSLPWIGVGVVLFVGALLVAQHGTDVEDELYSAGFLVGSFVLLVPAFYALVIRGLGVPSQRKTPNSGAIDDLLGPPSS